MAVSTKMSVDVSGFVSGMNQAQISIKSVNAMLKQNEAAFKLTGDREAYVQAQTSLLSKKMQEQQKSVDKLTKALAEMDKKGVDPMSKSYADMQTKLAKAQTDLMGTELQIQKLGETSIEAANGADQLTNSVNKIGKKMSLEQVISGVNSITDGLENAARKAVQFGEKLFGVIMDSAAQADDIDTLATRLGLTTEQVQQMMYVADRFEAPVEQMAKTWKKVKVNMASDSEEIVNGFKELGIITHEVFTGKYGDVEGAARDYQDVFWEIGDALLHMSDASEQERLAQKLLGRSWDELIPLFTAGREAYEAALKAAPTASDKAVESAASLNDRVKELEKSWDTLKLEVIGAVAPALEKGADALAKVLDSLTEYLQTDKGQEMLTKLGEAASGLLDDLGEIDPDSVVENVTKVITGLTDGLEWLTKNKDGVVNALRAVFDGWGLLKLTGGALDALKLISGLTGLAGGSGGSGAGIAAIGAALAAHPVLALSVAALTITAAAVMLHNTGPLEEAKRAGDVALAEREAFDSTVLTQSTNTDLNRAYTLTADYTTVSKTKTGMEALSELQNFAKIYHAFMYDFSEGLSKDDDDMMDMVTDVVESLGEDYAEDFAKAMDLVLANENDYTGESQQFVTDTIDKLKEALKAKMTDEVFQAQIEPEVPDDAASKVAKQIGTVAVPISLVARGGFGALAGIPGHANGIWSVPTDNYLALLHEGERVLTASQNRQYTFNSHTYFNNVSLNNGLEVDALADSIARRNAKQAAAYGQ